MPYPADVDAPPPVPWRPTPMDRLLLVVEWAVTHLKRP